MAKETLCNKIDKFLLPEDIRRISKAENIYEDFLIEYALRHSLALRGSELSPRMSRCEIFEQTRQKDFYDYYPCLGSMTLEQRRLYRSVVVIPESMDLLNCFANKNLVGKPITVSRLRKMIDCIRQLQEIKEIRSPQRYQLVYNSVNQATNIEGEIFALCDLVKRKLGIDDPFVIINRLSHIVCKNGEFLELMFPEVDENKKQKRLC